jgi:rhodanese-related sulfurtransferase
MMRGTRCACGSNFASTYTCCSVLPRGPRSPSISPCTPPKLRTTNDHPTHRRHTHTMTTIRQSHLIDVRSPVEFATGPLTSDIAPTINIEYQSIAQLPSIYAARGIDVHKDDDITLYCRSGRRSNIALETLKGIGYVNVRDIGGFEDAKRVLDKEQVQRQLDREMELMPGLEGEKVMEEEGKEHGKKDVRVKSFGALVEGLKALEE